MSVPYEELFKRSRDETPKQPPMPRGHYVLVLRGTFKRPPKEEGKSGSLSFMYEPVEAGDDVLPNELEEFAAGGVSLKESRPTADFWMGGWKDVQKVWDHLAVHGIAVDDYADLDTALKAAVNKRVIAYVTEDTYDHPVKGPQSRDRASGFKAIQ